MLEETNRRLQQELRVTRFVAGRTVKSILSDHRAPPGAMAQGDSDGGVLGADSS